MLLLYGVHRALDLLARAFARSHCARLGYDVRGVRSRPQFDAAGLKTEFTLVFVEALDREGTRRLLTLSVWLFGVRALLPDEAFPLPLSPLD